jgi:hypothetical protein
MKRTDTRGIKRSKQTRFDGSLSQKYLSLSLKKTKTRSWVVSGNTSTNFSKGQHL